MFIENLWLGVLEQHGGIPRTRQLYGVALSADEP